MPIDPISDGEGGASARGKVNAAIDVANAAVVGSGSAIAGRFPRFADTSGRLVSDGGPFVADDITNASAAGKAVLTAVDAATQRSNLGVVIGTHVQAYNANLAAIAGLSPSNDDILQRKSGAWVNRSLAQLRADLGWEDGTWTPTFTHATTPPTGVTYFVQTGNYRKRGNLCHVEGRLILTSKGTGAAGLGRIANLPFSALSPCAVGNFRFNGMTLPSNAYMCGSVSGVNLTLYRQSNASAGDTSPSDFTDATDIMFAADFAI